MVDRVGNGVGYTYPTMNEKRINTNTTGTGEKFQLDYGKEGAIYEPSSEAVKKQQEQKSVTAQTSAEKERETEGVRLTLSGAAIDGAQSPDKSKTGTGGILDAVTDVVNKLFDTIKKVFAIIWNDETTQDVSEEVNTADMADIKPEVGVEKSVEKPKTQFEKAKEEAEAFLASQEGKKAARNSDLLTYYDKHGSVVSVSPSDRQRILYGDKNQIEV